MACEFCTDQDGNIAYPVYGVGPHTCYYKIPGAVIGESQPLPPEQWPSNYAEDPHCPGMGIYWCEHCGEGKPEAAQQSATPAALEPCPLCGSDVALNIISPHSPC